jgi:hypothetical protein
MHLPRLFRVVVAVACAYEIVAIATKRLPTISRVSDLHPAFGALVMGGIHYHLRTNHKGDPRCAIHS